MMYPRPGYDGIRKIGEAAAEALGTIGDPRAVESLAAALCYSEPLDILAAKALVKIGVHAVEPLIAALKKKTFPDGRPAAIYALGKIGDPRAVVPLIDILREHCENSRLVNPAVDALVDLGQCAVEPLVSALKHGSVPHVCAALGRIRDTRAVDALLDALNGHYSSSVAEALGSIGDARAVEPLVTTLASSQIHKRKGAAYALVKIYKSGNLDDAKKRLILSQRARIMQTHTDQTTEAGHGDSSDCHSESAARSHADEGIGVAFPV